MHLYLKVRGRCGVMKHRHIRVEGVGGSAISRNINTQITVQAHQSICMCSHQACSKQFIQTLSKAVPFNRSPLHTVHQCFFIAL